MFDKVSTKKKSIPLAFLGLFAAARRRLKKGPEGLRQAGAVVELYLNK